MNRYLIAVTAAIAAFFMSSTGVYAFGSGGASAGQGQLPPGHAPVSGTSGPNFVDSDGKDLLAGEVAETLEAGGYTYMRITYEGGESWVAIPKQEVSVGDQMVFAPGDTMYDFESKTLKRKFDVIIFSPGPVYLPGTKVEKSLRVVDESKGIEKVGAAKGDNAYNVSNIFAQRLQLDKKKVKVRGKVVKVSQNIMKMNWVHIQDGSGNMKEGTHNLVVTTNDLPKVGDVVTVTGKVAADKDFGYGYRYDVIVEDAKIENK